jgi:hypothetical protein
MDEITIRQAQVAHRSNRCQQDNVHRIFREFLCDFGRADADESCRRRDGSHQTEMAFGETPDQLLGFEFTQPVQRKREIFVPLGPGVVKGVTLVTDLERSQLDILRNLTVGVVAAFIFGSNGSWPSP